MRIMKTWEIWLTEISMLLYKMASIEDLTKEELIAKLYENN